LQFNSLNNICSSKIVKTVILQKDQFPITIQAYEITNDSELFIAEQIVNSQAEVDLFSTKYAGKLIKAKATSISGTTGSTGSTGTTRTTATSGRETTSTNTNRKSSAATIIIVIVVLLLILLAIGYYTGWLQRTTGIDL
jgi:cobalamin biosynthesis Mg chelatase CobN